MWRIKYQGMRIGTTKHNVVMLVAVLRAMRYHDIATFERALDSDTGEAAKQHLAAGRPIYYGEPAYPGHVVKQFPDGRRQLVRVDMHTGEITVVRDL